MRIGLLLRRFIMIFAHITDMDVVSLIPTVVVALLLGVCVGVCVVLRFRVNG